MAKGILAGTLTFTEPSGSIGYAPIEPDGSVKIKVPANVPLAISVLDKDGRRIGGRHQNWLQTRPGEVITCNGCHDPNSGVSHGRADAFTRLNDGAPVDAYQFPNTASTFPDTMGLANFADFGETMAEARTRINQAALLPSVDIKYGDVWTDETVPGLVKDAPFDYSYANLDSGMTNPISPNSPGCDTTWAGNCRVVINYATHIHPLWSIVRGANGADTCTNCHARTDVNGNWCRCPHHSHQLPCPNRCKW